MQRSYRIQAIDELRRQQIRRASPDERLRRLEEVERAIAELDPNPDYAVDRIVTKIGCRGWVRPDRDKAAGAKSSDASAGDKNKTGAASPSKDGGGSSGESESIEPKAATAGKTKGAETTASR